MDMNKEFEAFSTTFDNGINDNNFVDRDNEIISGSLDNAILKQVQNDNILDDNSLCHPELVSGSQEILNLEERYRNERGMTESETSNIMSSRISETHCGIFKDTKMQKSLAFTLSESLIMMAIVGVIAVITLVSLSGLKPNKDKLLLQKAHRATLEAVAEIANDAVAYPPLKTADLSFRDSFLFAVRKQVEMAALMCVKTDLNGNPIETTNDDGLIEFVYTTYCPKETLTLTNTHTTWNVNPDLTLKPSADDGHTDSVLPNIGSVSETKSSSNVKITPASAVLTDRSVPKRDSGKYTSENKFAYLFAHIMQPSGKDISCNNKVCTFNTSDGMSWTVTDNFSAGNVNSTATIKVDINGDKKPNKAYNPDKPTEVKTPDQFTFTVRANGQVTVPANDAVAQKYLQSRK